ncbi:hypothetical protein [Frankia sp. Cr1]|uniref:hypothetical protein n=1 Tax=Frankia sp. Cr1 TaxID=3073931 RepID=UPI002AD4745B|nr:hypothetical protein [Frankia sp. Cr1]
MNRVQAITRLSLPIPAPGSGGDASADNHAAVTCDCGNLIDSVTDEDAGSRLAGQAGKLRAAAALIDRIAQVDADAHVYFNVTPYPRSPIAVQPGSPVGRGLTKQDEDLIEITLMGALAGLLDAQLIVTPHPEEGKLWLACDGSFLGQSVHAFAHVRDDPDLVEAANRLAAVGDDPGHDGDTSAGTPVVA